MISRNGILLTFELRKFEHSGDIFMRKLPDPTVKYKVAQKIDENKGSFSHFPGQYSYRGTMHEMKHALLNFVDDSKFVCTTWKGLRYLPDGFTPVKASLWDMKKPNIKISDFSVSNDCCPSDVKYSERDKLLLYSMNEGGAGGENEILGFDLRSKPKTPSLKISKKPQDIKHIEYITKMVPLLSRNMLVCGTSNGYFVSYDFRKPNSLLWTHDIVVGSRGYDSRFVVDMVSSADEKYIFCRWRRGEYACQLDTGDEKPKQIWTDTFQKIRGFTLCLLGEDRKKREIRLSLYKDENEDVLFEERMEFLMEELWKRKEEEKYLYSVVVEKRVFCRVPLCYLGMISIRVVDTK